MVPLIFPYRRGFFDEGGVPVRNSGEVGCEKYLSSGGANANRSRRLNAT